MSLYFVQGNMTSETCNPRITRQLTSSEVEQSERCDGLEMDTTTFINDGTYSSFDFFCPFCNETSELFLQVSDEGGVQNDINISCCSVNVLSSEILSSDNNTRVLQIVDPEYCPNSSTRYAIKGMLYKTT